MNRKILNEIQSIKRRIVPNGRVFLFGSQVRGDAHQDSDWDLLVLLNKDKISYEDENLYAYPFAEMGWAYGTYISVKLYTENEWQLRSITPFYHNVQKDGVEILKQSGMNYKTDSKRNMKQVVTMSQAEYKRYLAFKDADRVVRGLKRGLRQMQEAKVGKRVLKSAYQLADEL